MNINNQLAFCYKAFRTDKKIQKSDKIHKENKNKTNKFKIQEKQQEV